MECEIKYRPIIFSTHKDDRVAMKAAYLQGDGNCPACDRDGRTSAIEERFGETS